MSYDDIKDDEDFSIPRNTNYHNNPKPKAVAYKGEEIKTWREMTREDRDKVKSVYWEGTIKGFKLWQMRDFIFAKTKIVISKRFLYDIKRQHEMDNREWYYKYARDKFAYVGAYRKCIDKVEMCEEVLWKLTLNPNESGMVKVAAVKEIHNLAKTNVLLLKDLPFVMNLSQNYDISLLDPENKGIGRLGVSPDSHEGGQRISYLDTETDKMKGSNTSLVFDTLERIETGHTRVDELSKRLKQQAMNSQNSNQEDE